MLQHVPRYTAHYYQNGQNDQLCILLSKEIATNYDMKIFTLKICKTKDCDDLVHIWSQDLSLIKNVGIMLLLLKLTSGDVPHYSGHGKEVIGDK